MQPVRLHRFEMDGKCFVIDTHTCFCFECDRISWDVLEYYPDEPINRIYHLLKDLHPLKDLEEVVGELEWLRVTKAILTQQADREFMEQAARAGGLSHVTCIVGATPAWAGQSSRFLLARSGDEKALTLSLFIEKAASSGWDAVAAALEESRRLARLADKHLRLEMEFPFHPLSGDAAQTTGCEFRCRIALAEGTDVATGIHQIMALDKGKSRAAFEALWKQNVPESVRIIAQPLNAGFQSVVSELHKAGYKDIVLDLVNAWTAQPRLDPEAVVDALRANAEYYAEQLLRNNLFRVEPFASLFTAIHDGTPRYRVDRSGVESFTVDGGGMLYPSRALAGNPSFCLGSLDEGRLNETAREPFTVSGALQNPVCLCCWARGLCGGGHSAVHYARTGKVREPDPLWCEAQRRWMAIAVATFNRIASSGVNFSHLASAMRPQTQRVSLLTAAKAILQGRMGVRPLREDDAPKLVRWENWNRAAYFVCNDTGALTATQYDREMDALHPSELARELVLTGRNGEPCGLIKLKPVPGRRLAWAWLYMQDAGLYAKSSLRHTLRDLLQEVCKSQRIRHIVVPATPWEKDLAEALKAAGFKQAGTEREGLYQKGTYHDVSLYVYTAAET